MSDQAIIRNLKKGLVALRQVNNLIEREESHLKMPGAYETDRCESVLSALREIKDEVDKVK